MDRTGTAAETPWPKSGYAWYVVAILYLAAVISFIDRQIIALMVDDIRADLGLSDLQIGLLQGPPFGIFYALMSLPIAIAADRRNRRNIIIAGVTFWSAATAACGLAGSFWHLFVARVGVGVGEATLNPSAYSMISDYFRREKLPLALAVFTMGNLTGVGLAMVLGGLLIGALHALGPVQWPVLGELRPWQMTFILVGLPGLLLAVLMLTIREPVRRGITGQDAGISAGLDEFWQFLRDNRRTFASLFASFTLLALIAYANFSWIVVFLMRTFDWTPSQAGVGFGLAVLCFGTAGAFFGGWLAKTLSEHGYKDATYRATLICSLPLAPLAVIAFLVAGTGGTALLSFGVFQFFGAVPAGLAAASMMSISPNQMRAKISATYLFFTNIVGMSLGPTTVGFLTTKVFVDDASVGKSLAIVNAIGAPLAVLIISFGMRAYWQAVERMESREAVAAAA